MTEMLYELYIDGWERDIKFSASHFIPHHVKCHRLHGHTYVVSVVLRGTLGAENMVFDFSTAKPILREVISDLDHKVLIPEGSKLIEISKTEDKVSISVGSKEYLFPREDVTLLPIESTTAECLAEYILGRLRGKITGDNIASICVKVEEGKGQGAMACYDKQAN